YISSTEGYISHSLQKCIEVDNQYILLVEGTSVEAQEVGFRQSPQYEKWKALLHNYYDPFPPVLHYKDVKKNTDAHQQNRYLLAGISKGITNLAPGDASHA